MLNTYLQQLQRLIRDQTQAMNNVGDLVSYVNLARRETAMRSQSIRVLPLISGTVVSVSITNAGSGYTGATATITPPDFPGGTSTNPMGLQATAIPVVSAGTIASVSISNPGSGYFQPQITVNGGAGVNFAGTVNISKINQTVEGQEIYPFSAIDLSPFPGVSTIIAVHSVSIIYANYRYSLPQYSFSTYQSSIRQYPFQYQYVPTLCSQFGQGANGSLYVYPIPSQAYQMEWDCFAFPIDLVDDSTVEALPAPWTDAVQYFAAYLVYLERQDANRAKFFQDRFDEFMHRYSTYARMSRATNPYGRY